MDYSEKELFKVMQLVFKKLLTKDYIYIYINDASHSAKLVIVDFTEKKYYGNEINWMATLLTIRTIY